ncbi:MAG TPA: 4-hydroxy-tetrahydrodipicolinate synthase [Candidatus Macondimonas sp.]|nr:4-hydroxy-tetrahydrodipicolinate synthase [Candidatus Macondimonas sp.]
MITGSLVALATPMHPDGAIDWEAFARLIEFHVEEGTDALVVAGTTGEASTLSFAEHCELLRTAVVQVRGRIPVIAGTGANATSEAIELTRAAKEAGVDACLLVSPYYVKPTQEGLYRHHRAIAEAVAIPQILYNVPGRTGVDLKPDTVVRLASVPHIVGLKEATGDLDRMRTVLQSCPSDFAVYSGDDATACEAILMGAKGDISVTANVAPRAMHAMCRAALDGDAETARAINAGLARLHRDLFVESNPIPTKWALMRMGLIGPGIRLPMTPLDPSCYAVVTEALEQAGISL